MCHRLNRGQHLFNLESGVVDAVVDADAVIGCTNEAERKALLRDVGCHVLYRLGVADLVLGDAVLINTQTIFVNLFRCYILFRPG